MKIVMLKEAKGSQDGIKVETFEEGVEYTVAQSLGRVFVSSGVAELATEKAAKEEKKAAETVKKAVKKAPKNKARDLEEKEDK